jgi:tetratricopeptide (TPR) repeat protein
MTREKVTSTSETLANQPEEQAPVVTPEIEDGYDSPVKKLVCVACLHPFYISISVYQSLNPTHCNMCSTRILAEYKIKQERKLAEQQREQAEREEKLAGEVYQAISADTNRDSPEVAYVRRLLEHNMKDKKGKLFGYEILLCVPHIFEKDEVRWQCWRVTLTRSVSSKGHMHILVIIIEFNEYSRMILPFDEHYVEHKERSLEEQLEETDRAIEERPAEAFLYRQKASLLGERGQDDEALRCYEKALEIDPLDAHTYDMMGNVLARLDRAGDALMCYEKAISLKPNDANGYNSKARLLENLGRGEEALATLDAFIASYPTNLDGYLNKARLYFRRKEYEKARAVHVEGRIAAGIVEKG